MKVSQQVSNIQNVMMETEQLTFKQGEQLDIIGEELDTTHSNIAKANENL